MGDNTPPTNRHPNYKVINQKLGSEFDADGKVVEATSDFHITPDAIRATQASNALLASIPKLGSEASPNRKLDDRLLESVRKFAGRMGLEKVPEIYVLTAEAARPPTVASGFTKEGTPFIMLDTAALKTFSPEQLEGFLALETDRLKNGDAVPETMAAGLNNPVLAFERTYRADRNAAGPLGTCNPSALEQGLLKIDDLRVKALVAAGATDPRDPEHPPVTDRVARLKEQERQQLGVCRPTVGLPIPK